MQGFLNGPMGWKINLPQGRNPKLSWGIFFLSKEEGFDAFLRICPEKCFRCAVNITVNGAIFGV